MGNREITIQHQGGTYTGRPGKITGTSLSYDPATGLVPVLEVQGGDWAVRLDGVVLGRVAEDANGMPSEQGNGMAVSHLARLLDTVGVGQWETLTGSPVYVLSDADGAGVGIAHLTDESKVMVFELHAGPWLAMQQFPQGDHEVIDAEIVEDEPENRREPRSPKTDVEGEH